MENVKKRKFDIKVWLATLGIALFSCGMAFCAKAADTYNRADAYEYESNGNLIFALDTDVPEGNFNLSLLYNFMIYNDIDGVIGPFEFNTTGFLEDDDDHTFDIVYLEIDTAETYPWLSIYLNNDHYVIFNYSNNVWRLIESDAVIAPVRYISFTNEDDIYYPLLNYSLSYNAPQSTGNFLTALTDFVQLITNGIVDLGRGVATGVVSMASSLFLDNGSLSIMGGIIGIFAGIALAVGITTKVYTWVTSLGN